ncbi:MAG: DUF1566 domain-containing protein, partial [Longimicrobiales bacterium]
IDELNDVFGGGADCFAGYCDWRAPNKNELITLVDSEVFNPSINLAFNQCSPPCSDVTDPACSCTAGGDYWSATTSAPDPTYAWAVDFGNGDAGVIPKGFPEGLKHVRAVRAGS